MAEPVRKDQPLMPSILDRLIDLEPTNRQELPQSRHQVLREIKLSVRRDLENLLNTRWRCVSWPSELGQLETSLVNYGIPDFSGTNMSIPAEREQMRSTIEDVIRRFEPRFKTVKVTMLTNPDEFDRTLRFRIDALLHAEPAPEPVTFDSTLQPTTATFEVKTQGS
jgi:type VI secretion system protein ImpF